MKQIASLVSQRELIPKWFTFCEWRMSEATGSAWGLERGRGMSQCGRQDTKPGVLTAHQKARLSPCWPSHLKHGDVTWPDHRRKLQWWSVAQRARINCSSLYVILCFSLRIFLKDFVYYLSQFLCYSGSLERPAPSVTGKCIHPFWWGKLYFHLGPQKDDNIKMASGVLSDGDCIGLWTEWVLLRPYSPDLWPLRRKKNYSGSEQTELGS